MIVRRSTYEAAVADCERLMDAVKEDLAVIDGLRRERDGLSRERDNALAHAATVKEERDWLRNQVAAKDAMIWAMQREGFEPPAPTPPAHERGPDLDIEVRKAIERVASPGSDLWMLESARARREISLGKAPGDVAEEIERGSKLNPFHA